MEKACSSLRQQIKNKMNSVASKQNISIISSPLWYSDGECDFESWEGVICKERCQKMGFKSQVISENRGGGTTG